MAIASQFTDRSGGTPGTAVVRQYLGALVVADSFVKSGALPTFSGMILTFPTQVVVVNPQNGSPALEVQKTGSTYTITGAGNTDNYVFLSTAGAYSQTAVTHNNNPPSTPTGTICVCMATTNVGGTAITAVAGVAPTTAQIGAASVAADRTATVSGFTWDASKTLAQQLEALATLLATLNSSLTTINSQISTINGTLATDNTSIGTLNSENVTNTAAIAANVANIATNAANIVTNTASIASHTIELASHQASITALPTNYLETSAANFPSTFNVPSARINLQSMQIDGVFISAWVSGSHSFNGINLAANQWNYLAPSYYAVPTTIPYTVICGILGPNTNSLCVLPIVLNNAGGFLIYATVAGNFSFTVYWDIISH